MLTRVGTFYQPHGPSPRAGKERHRGLGFFLAFQLGGSSFFGRVAAVYSFFLRETKGTAAIFAGPTKPTQMSFSGCVARVVQRRLLSLLDYCIGSPHKMVNPMRLLASSPFSARVTRQRSHLSEDPEGGSVEPRALCSVCARRQAVLTRSLVVGGASVDRKQARLTRATPI